jgi:hypothetical protein
MTQPIALRKPQQNHEEDWLVSLELLQGDFEALAALMLKTIEDMGLAEHSHPSRVLNFLICNMHQKSDDFETLIKQKPLPLGA